MPPRSRAESLDGAGAKGAKQIFLSEVAALQGYRSWCPEGLLGV